MASITEWLLKFYACSFLGWLLETAIFSINNRRWINRGFLNGPFCLIYGFGAILLLGLLSPLRNTWLLVFLAGAAITTLLEYLASWVLEKLFKARWWDYSGKPFNFQGRITLYHSLIWGLLGLALIYGLNPLFDSALLLVSPAIQMIGSIGITLLIMFDLWLTVSGLIDLDRHLASIQERIRQIRSLNGQFRSNVNTRLTIMAHNFRELRSHAVKISNVQIRLLRAFPNLRSIKYPEAMRRLRHWLQNRRPRHNWPMAGIRMIRNQLPALRAYRKRKNKPDL